LALNAHSPIQLLSGFLLGFGLQLLSIFWSFKKILGGGF
jgi:hypothetical protein